MGLTNHEQLLEDLHIVVQWALRGRMTLVDVVDNGTMVSLHFYNVRDSWRWEETIDDILWDTIVIPFVMWWAFPCCRLFCVFLCNFLCVL